MLKLNLMIQKSVDALLRKTANRSSSMELVRDSGRISLASGRRTQGGLPESHPRSQRRYRGTVRQGPHTGCKLSRVGVATIQTEMALMLDQGRRSCIRRINHLGGGGGVLRPGGGVLNRQSISKGCRYRYCKIC
jgi:hypothetical protein